MASEYETRRLAFADRLRRLREGAGLTGVELADTVRWQQSKVSKIERARQMPTEADVMAWLQAVNAEPDIVEDVRLELSELRVEQLTWRGQLRNGHLARQMRGQREAEVVTRRRGLAVAIVPGLVQTPDYARAVFQTQCSLLEVPEDVEASVAARIARQSVLYDTTKQIEILIAEAVLSHPVCEANTLAGQLDRLMSLIGLANVRFGILPAGRVLPHLLPHGFWILDDIAVVETVTEELLIADQEQVAIYERLLDRLWPAAAQGEDARVVLLGARERLSRTAH